MRQELSVIFQDDIPAGQESEVVLNITPDMIEDMYSRLQFPEGHMSMEMSVSGTGNITCSYKCTNSGDIFSTPEDAEDIFLNKTSGNYFNSFTIPLCIKAKFIFKNTGSGPSNVKATLYRV